MHLLQTTNVQKGITLPSAYLPTTTPVHSFQVILPLHPVVEKLLESLLVALFHSQLSLHFVHEVLLIYFLKVMIPKVIS